MFTRYAVVLALSAVALGKVFITEPVATTTWAAGGPQTVSWQDDGAAPDLTSFGPAKISIYVGNAQQQTLLQTITPSLDVSTAGSVEFTPDPTIGPNGNQYFIRFESLGLKDPAAPAAPALSFSAKFTMSGMTGTFSPEVQAQINGASTAPLGASSTPAVTTSAATTSAAAPAVPSTTPAKTTPTTSSKASSASASGTAGANATKPSGAATSLSHSSFVALAAAAAIGVGLY